MHQYRQGFTSIGVALLLAALLFLPFTVMAQSGDRPEVRLKTQIWMMGGLAELPRLPLTLATASAVASDPQADAGAYWSQIAFQSYRDGNWEIYWMNRFGANQTRLTHDPGSDLRPRLSPDLTEVVFASKRDGNWEIYKMKTDGSGLLRLTNNASDDADPAWSPDGRYITFARKKDDHWSIYRMKADGSGQWRLTYPGDDNDISPSWSPDGNEIAWVRRGTWGYGDVMVMQANGNNLHTLYPHLRYLQNVVWSPDGQYLAFDADTDGDDWNQLEIIRRSDGGVQWEDWGLGSFKDEWLGSWSPDGRYLLFSQIKYVVQDNKLYIAETRLKKIDFHSRAMSGFSDTGLDMAPDWQQGTDHLAPTAFIDALPAVSPSPIAVHWSGTDAGPSGIVSYDVQVRSDGGAWSDWHSATNDTTAEYSGKGGHRYAFRVRVRDDAGNVSPWTDEQAAQTTVESLPPHSVFDPLPGTFIRIGGVISWRGEDEGGSGVIGYDVQYKELGTDSWTSWLQETNRTSDTFLGTYGKSYFFRVRAIDRAQNLGSWYETAAASTVYQWGITGFIYDNRHRPIADVMISSTPAGQFGGISGESGAYYLYTTAWKDHYQVQWQKPGYGSLPTTSYGTARDARTDMALPPPDNVVRQGSFEISGTQTAWQAGGIFPAKWSTGNIHTGSQAARVGLMTYQANFVHIENRGDDLGVKLVIDDLGNRHLSWHSAGETFFYSRIGADGRLSPVKQFGSHGVWNRQLAVTHNGIVHAAWLDPLTAYHYPFYAVSQADGTWSQRKLDVNGSFITAVDEQGTFHILYKDAKLYQQRRANGVWSIPEQPPTWNGNMQKMVAAPDGTLYLFLQQGDWFDSRWSYVVRDPDGRWHDWQGVPASRGYWSPVIRVDAQKTLHFLARKLDTTSVTPLIYIRLEANGQWTSKEFKVSKSNYGPKYDLFVDENGQTHIIIAQESWPDLVLFYARREASGSWHIEQSQTIYRNTTGVRFPHSDSLRFAVDSQRRIYVVGADYNSMMAGVRGTDGIWHLWVPSRSVCQVSTPYPEKDLTVAIAIDQNDIPYIAWPGGAPCDIYSTSAISKNGGDSYLRQVLSIPATMNDPTFSFFYRFPRPLPSPSALELSIDDGLCSTTLFSTTVSAEDWTQQWLDMTPWAGQTITLTFAVPQLPGNFSTWAEIDDVTLGSASYPDLWMAGQTMTPAPGDSLRLHLPFGNAGDTISHDTQLTLTLPLSFTLVAADPPPTTKPSDHVWQWALGDLAPALQSELLITATVPTSITAGSVLRGTVSIGSPATELIGENNERPVLIFIDGRTFYLPLITNPGT